jgi:Ser/Thr protein kinase RdoA (MazF antagonist)/GNAT superfamily N-acetyltransferase
MSAENKQHRGANIPSPGKEDIEHSCNALYNARILSENTAGYSGDRLFLTETTTGMHYLRLSKYTPAHLSKTFFETRWVRYLADRMSGIVEYVPSVHGNYFEIAEIDGENYILTMQKKAVGTTIDPSGINELDSDLLCELGKLMGQMHRLTSTYDGNVPCDLFKWNGPHFWRKDIEISRNDVKLAEQELVAELEALPISPESYGIVHFDIHTNNFLVENGKITLIDFDTCQFNWYAADIASALFFMVQKVTSPAKIMSEEIRTSFAEWCLTAFLKGYLQEYTLSEYWLSKIELFMRYQMIDEFVAAGMFLADESSDKINAYSDWYKDRIVSKKPYVYLDYSKLLNTPISIRDYKPSDCATMAKLFYDTVHVVNAADYSQEQLDAWATGTVNLKKMNESFLSHRTVVAWKDDLLVGFGDMDETGYLDRLYVHKDHQRQGIATAICDVLEAECPTKQFTTHASITARPFFEKRGYVVIKEQQVERFGVWLTNFVMGKGR